MWCFLFSSHLGPEVVFFLSFAAWKDFCFISLKVGLFFFIEFVIII